MRRVRAPKHKEQGQDTQGLGNKTNKGAMHNQAPTHNKRTRPIKDKNGPNTSDTYPLTRGDGRRKRKHNDNNTTPTTTHELRGKRYNSNSLPSHPPSIG